MKATLIFLLLVSFEFVVWGQWFQYQLVLEPGYYFYQRGSFFTPEDAPFGYKRPSHLAFEFQFSDLRPPLNPNPNSTYARDVEVVVTHWSQLTNIGIPGTDNICCTSELAASGVCQNPDYTVFSVSTDPAENGNLLWYFNETLPADLAVRINITVSGPYYLLIINCDDSNAIPWDQTPVNIGVTGLSEWKNPYGYLPAQVYPFLPLYWIFFILYTILALIMGILAFIFRRDLTPIQWGIGIMLAISLIENLIWGIDYLLFNRSGEVSEAFIIVGVVFSTAKLTMFRLLLLLICLGYSITKPQLPRNVKLLIMLLTMFYFFITLVNLYTLVVNSLGTYVSPALIFFLSFLVTIVNLLFFGWIFISLFITMKGLKMANERVKFKMYRHLGLTLVGCAIALAVVFIFEFIAVVASLEDPWWRFWWFFDTYWELIYLAVITVICFVWRPTSNNRRFAYVPLNDERIEMGNAPPGSVMSPSFTPSGSSQPKSTTETQFQTPSDNPEVSVSQSQDVRERSESMSQSQSVPKEQTPHDDSSSSEGNKDIRD